MTKEQLIQQTARACHYNNKAFCESIGDYSQSNWEDADDWQREAAIEQTTAHFENGPIDAGTSHRKWMEQKLANGWQVGPVKDGELKTHPDLVPFEDLSFEAKVKDYIFNYTCRTAEFLLGDKVSENT